MAGIVYKGNKAKTKIPLSILPEHDNVPNAIGCTKHHRAGDVINGYDKYSYALNTDDELIVISQHQSDTVQVILKSRDPNIIAHLPGTMANSLVKNTIQILQSYISRQQGYREQLSSAQKTKQAIATGAIAQLRSLLGRERTLMPGDLSGQEHLRNDVIKILEFARDKNRQLSDSITIAEGELNRALYRAAHEYAAEYHFNQSTAVSRQDQLDFSTIEESIDSIQNPELKRILLEDVKLELTAALIRKLNQYFSTTAPCPKFNKRALRRLLSQVTAEESRSRLSQTEVVNLLAVIEHEYQSIEDAHEQQDLPMSDKTIVWDSQYHLGSDKAALDDAIRTICQHYDLGLPKALKSTESHRFKRMRRFFTQFWQQCQTAADHYASKDKPSDTIDMEHRDHLRITTIDPDYLFSGIKQQPYSDIESLASACLKLDEELPQQIHPSIEDETLDAGSHLLLGQFITQSEGNHYILLGKRADNSLIRQAYYINNDNACVPIPDGEDIYSVTQASKRNIFWLERLKLKARAFITNIPPMCRLGYQKIKQFVLETIPEHFTKHMHQGHIIDPHLRAYLSTKCTVTTTQADCINRIIESFLHKSFYHPWAIEESVEPIALRRDMVDQLKLACNEVGLQLNVFDDDLLTDDGPLQDIFTNQASLIEQDKQHMTDALRQQETISHLLKNEGYLNDGDTLFELIDRLCEGENLLFAQAEHAIEDKHFNDPFNRSYEIIRHFCKFFLDYSEKSPLIGTLAFAAYAYGGAAVLTPHTLTALLAKLHLSFLAKGIAPTQALGKIIANGASSEAIAAGFTYWQAVVLAGDIDDFAAQAVKLINDDPVQIAVVTALAILLGYLMCKAVPPLQEEVGSFPYYSYGALGAKGGLVIYDAVMYPGDDVVTGTLKWFIGIPAFIGQCLISPLVEWSHYGFSDGFLYGCKKSLVAAKDKLKHALAGGMHLGLSIAALPFSELASFCLHIPFRGLSKLVTKSLASLGDLKGIGRQLLQFATRQRSWHYFNTFRPCPLYGFGNPFGNYYDNPVANVVANVAMGIIVPTKDIVKNVIALPLLDLSSLLIRSTLTAVVNPITRSVAAIVGGLSYAIGMVSDPTVGRVSRLSAGLIGQGVDGLDRQCGRFKRWVLSGLSKTKSRLRRWAYGDEGTKQKQSSYYQQNPLELNKACNSTALIKALLPQKEMTIDIDEYASSNSHHLQSTPVVELPGNDALYDDTRGNHVDSMYSL